MTKLQRFSTITLKHYVQLNIKIQNKTYKIINLLSLNHPKRQVSQVPKVGNKTIKKKKNKLDLHSDFTRVYLSLPDFT